MLQKRRYFALSLDSSQLFDLSKLFSWLRSRVARRVNLLASSAELLGLTTSSVLPFEDHWTFTVNVLALALSVRVSLEHYWSFSDFLLLCCGQLNPSGFAHTHTHTYTHTHWPTTHCSLMATRHMLTQHTRLPATLLGAHFCSHTLRHTHSYPKHTYTQVPSSSHPH